ncbi:sorting nexin-7 isoform X2 [Ambystoma mexicanum]|uniref:sorting nexin-7 isoform X2 n=1 Tax=Ambystoma mexicanum TaxID=8296 RepID=UPI0037E959ED
MSGGPGTQRVEEIERASGPPLHTPLPNTLPLCAEALEFDEDDDLEVFSKDTTLTDGNSFSSLIPTSPSSMTNQYKFEDEPDISDLFITVDDPESHITAIETFITYQVVTKTTRGEFDSSEYEVRRRYQDFLWLKSKLEESHPTLIIPELTSHKKQGPGFLERMGQSVRAVASSMRGVKNRPDDITVISDYVDIFNQKINALDKIAHRIYKEEKEYVEEMKEYGPIFTLWSASEEDLTASLKGIAGCIDKCCRATEQQMSGLSASLIPITHEYVLYSDMLTGVMKRRDQMQSELDGKVYAVANKKTDTERLKEEVGKLEDKVECANNALKADWDRWKQNMQNDMKSAFTTMAENNVNYYEECLATWESFLSSQTSELQAEEDPEQRL